MQSRRVLVRWLSASLTALLLLGAPAPAADAVPPPVPTSTSLATAVTLKPALQRVLRRVNAVRARHGRKPVRAHRCLTRKFAQPWATHLAETQTFTHQDISAIFSTCSGSGFHAVGENTAAGQPTAKAVMKAWMHSPGHRRNILSRSFTRIGLGLATDKDGTRYWVQDFGG